MNKEMMEALEADAEKLRQLTGEDHSVVFLADKPPYPFCHTPEKCAGKNYCPNDPACND